MPTTQYIRYPSLGGGGGGSGTVTSVGLSLPSIFTVSGSPVTTSGTLTGSFNTQSANTFFSGPSSGPAATPTFRALTNNDVSALTTMASLILPTSQLSGSIQLSQIQQISTDTILGNNTAGNSIPIALSTAQVNAILPVFTSTLNGLATASGGGTVNFLRADGSWASPPGVGTVTSVALADSTGLFNITGSPVTSSGTLTLSSLQSQAANTVFAAPNGSSGSPTFRLLASADIPDLSALYVTQTEVGQPNGVASLDGAGKVPVSQLPSAVLEYQGAWDPSTNTPTLQDSTGTNGFVYYVSTAFAGPISGLTDPSMVNFQVGNLVIYSSAVGKWQQTTPAAGVQSVNGAQGVVIVNAINQLTGDVTAGPASQSQSQASTIASIQGTIVAGTTGTGNVVFSASPTLTGTITAAAANFSGAISASNFSGSSSGTNTGDQTITLTGPVTGSGTGSIATSVTNNAITNAMLAQAPTLTLKGNNTGGTANVSDLTVAQVNAILPVFTPILNGLVPASGGGTVNYLRADGTFAAPPGATSGTVTSVDMTVPAFLSISGNPITTSGTLALTLSGTALPVLNGGTGDTSFTANQVVLGGTTSTGPLTQVPGGTPGYILTSNGTTAAPTFQPAPGTVSAFYASSQVTTDSTVVSSTSFTTTSNSPAFTFTPSITGTYKVYASIPLDSQSTTNNMASRIFNTSGGATLLEESLGTVYSTASFAVASVFTQSVYTLVAGTPYVFDIQIKAFPTGSGIVNASSSSGGPFYMFAELEATGSLPLQVSSINSLSGAITLAAGTNTTIVPSGNTLTFNSAGSVSSVALSDASSTPIFNISGSPVTSSGTLTQTLTTQAANTIFAGPATGSPAQPTFRALVNSDVGTLTVANISTTSNSTLTTLSSLSLPTSQLSGTVSLTTQVSGVLPIANGGTNNGSLPVTAGGVIYTDGTKLQNVGAGTAGFVLTSNGASAPTWNASGGGGGTFQFFASTQVTTDSAVINTTAFTTFSNSPAFTFTPTVSGTYKVYASPNLYNGGSNSNVARIFETTALATLLYESQGRASASTPSAIESTTFIQSVYTLVASTTYTFDIQGKLTSFPGDCEMIASASPFYMFAEQCG